MKKLKILTTVLLIAGACIPTISYFIKKESAGVTCVAATLCKACGDCKSCEGCAKDGEKCGACKK